MMQRSRLVVAVGITSLLGCGSPPPDHSASTTTTAADAVGPTATSAGANASFVGHKPVSPSPTHTTLLGPTDPTVPSQEALPKKDPRITTTDTTHAQASTPSQAPSEVNQQALTEQAQYEARHTWLSEIRENPNASVRLMALEVWAQHPDLDIDPRTFVMDEDNEQIQARALELWEKYAIQQPEEPEVTPSVQYPGSQDTAPGEVVQLDGQCESCRN